MAELKTIYQRLDGEPGCGIWKDIGVQEYNRVGTLWRRVVKVMEGDDAMLAELGYFQDAAGTIPVTAIEQPVGDAKQAGAPLTCIDCGRSDCPEGINAQGVCFQCVYGGSPEREAVAPLPLAPSEALRDVLAEREKQRTNYGDPHDDEHGHRILSDEAAGYLMSGQAPMRASWCYNSKVRDRDPRRMQLVKGVALGLAAIECLDRGPRYRATAPQALPMEPSDRAQFSAAMVDGGWDAPATNGRGDAFLFERDEDRYVGWKLARATPPQATLPASIRQVDEKEAMKGGRWTSSDDVERMARDLYRAMYPGETPPVNCSLVYVIHEATRRLATLPASEPKCYMPPLGWRCTRTPGHNGPCAAVKDDPFDARPGESSEQYVRRLNATRAQPQADEAETIRRVAGAVAKHFKEYEAARGEAAGDYFTDPFTKKPQINQVSIPVPFLRALCESLSAKKEGQP